MENHIYNYFSNEYNKNKITNEWIIDLINLDIQKNIHNSNIDDLINKIKKIQETYKNNIYIYNNIQDIINSLL